ncbi:diguanylate cyclase [Williamsia sp. CHRR-6]|uniref:GGDEF domain-containing protein n=1 Tax=Williamsia sp. CHRR-6 TaxID=2835871 RepID=UPI001BD9DB80|nr:GGDEF domain-containing protein [Williamsia sp. CHRR-6]MBT0565363.1 GGDEF domain-containing protein [Williamsia sp. CHRR-6]
MHTEDRREAATTAARSAGDLPVRGSLAPDANTDAARPDHAAESERTYLTQPTAQTDPAAPGSTHTAAASAVSRRTRFDGWARGVTGHFDARTAAVVLSTSGALPLPLFALVQPSLIRPGGLPALGVIWLFTLVVFTTSVLLGRLSDRMFSIFGLIGMAGIAGSAYLVDEPATSGVITTLLAAIPAIAAMSSSRSVVIGFSLFAVALAVLVAFTAATSMAGVLVRSGAGVANVMVPVFVVAALRGSLEVTMQRYAVLGNTDPLTGLLNRRGFLERSPDVLATIAGAGAQVGFLLIDVDHFKSVNDRLGHAGGDAVLVDTVQAIVSAAPADALIGRFGGEEFVVMCATSGPPDLAATAEQIRSAVPRRSPVTVSIGAVAAALTCDRAGSTNVAGVIDHLTHLADRWVYVAKSAGRDRVVCLGSSPVHVVTGTATPPHLRVRGFSS